MNPLLAPWHGPYGGVPPWDQMRPRDFPAAFEAAVADERAEIDAIVGNSDPATFENTFTAKERAGKHARPPRHHVRGSPTEHHHG